MAKLVKIIRSPFLWAATIGACLPLLAWSLLPVASEAQTSGDKLQDIQSQIDHKRKEVGERKDYEGTLVKDINYHTSKVEKLENSIGSLRRTQIQIQTKLDTRKEELFKIQDDLRKQRALSVKYSERLKRSKKILSTRLRELYMADDPDVLSAVLSVDGFSDLIERGELLNKLREQDKRIVTMVRDAKQDADRAKEKLGSLENAQQKKMASIVKSRDAIAENKQQLVDRRAEFASARAQKQAVLNSSKAKTHHLEEDLAGLEAASEKIGNAIRSAQSPGSQPAGPVKPGSGGFIWPINSSITSPFGPRWGRMHTGLDLEGVTGDPIRAAKSGTVIVAGGGAGYSGYGIVTVIDHGGGVSTLYAHQSSLAVSNGAKVKQGQVIGRVGCTGHCFGDHLHFEIRINGNPVNPAGYL